MRGAVKSRFPSRILAGLFLAAALPAAAADFSWTFGINGLTDFRLTAVSSSSVYSGAIPVNDPTLNLVIGRSYQVTNGAFAAHPFQVVAQGVTSATDVVLLSQGGGAGSMEADSGVGWLDDGLGNVTFRVTQNLLDALTQGGRTPGYRCQVHPSTMRGAFNITPPPFDHQWTFTANGASDYRLTSVSTAELFGGVLPADDPAITLRIGKRYRVLNADPLVHPLEIAALGASSGFDTPLLSQSSTLSTLEDDPGIAWHDDGGSVIEFTVTVTLINALTAGGLSPGYRCEAHPDAMRGLFMFITSSANWEIYE